MHDEGQTADKFGQLIDIVTRLRAPDGCPWDRKQTPQTFKTYLIEEAHELALAIDRGDAAEVCEELGDLLFQIVFIGNLYAEEGTFLLADCLETIIAKMIRRHPHVFGEAKIETEEELKHQWHTIKKTEEKKTDPLEGVPRSLPGLHRAHRILDRAARITPDGGRNPSGIDGLRRAIGELDGAIESDDRDGFAARIGALLFDLVRLSRTAGVNAEDALQRRIDGFVAEVRR
ncbi:MAG: nucleoside triphosphate pyrophosphohydrolase [Thermodesulfobacteriota bacterium]